MKRRKLALSRMFLSAVLDATASCLSNSRAQPTASQPSFVEKCLPNDDDVLSISSETSTNVSAVAAASCKSSSTACSTKAHYPVTYFRILVEDAADRLFEAMKFFLRTGSYSLKFEFHIKILNDLFEELGNPPQHMDIEEYDNVLQLRQRLRQLQLNLVERRNRFLGYANDIDQSRNVKISPQAGAESYLEVAAKAKAARERQCKMVVLIEKIANLGREEEEYKQRRLKVEAELLRCVDKLVQPSDDNGDNGKTKYDKSDPVDGTASVGKEHMHNGELTSTNQVREDGYEFECSSAGLSINPHTICYGRRWEIAVTKKSCAAANQEILFSKPSTPCIFCGELHCSHLCLKIPTLEKRQMYFLEHSICPICGTSHKAACEDTVRFCKWPGCQARNSHHSALCPSVEYPITAEVIKTYVRQLDDMNRIYEYSKVSEW